jgi:hypothetical protein
MAKKNTKKYMKNIYLSKSLEDALLSISLKPLLKTV